MRENAGYVRLFMTRKAALLTKVLSHFAVSFACGLLLSDRFASSVGWASVLTEGGLVLFFLLAYGLRPFLGVFLDEFPRFYAQSLGAVLVGAAFLLPLAWTWVLPSIAGIGYALFATGIGGESLAFGRGYFLRCGCVLSTGILGFASGLHWVLFPIPRGVTVALTVIAALACFFFSEARKYPRRIRSFRHSAATYLPRKLVPWMLLFPLLLSSLIGAFLPASAFDGIGILIPVGCCAVGRVLGALCADLFGPRKSVAVGLGIALPMMTVFLHIPWLYCLGLAALNSVVSASFGAMTSVFPSRPHFVFGMGSVALLCGMIPSLFALTATSTLRIVCGVLLLAGIVAARILYTDHCKPMQNFFRNRERGDAL